MGRSRPRAEKTGDDESSPEERASDEEFQPEEGSSSTKKALKGTVSHLATLGLAITKPASNVIVLGVPARLNVVERSEAGSSSCKAWISQQRPRAKQEVDVTVSTMWKSLVPKDSENRECAMDVAHRPA